MAVVVTVMVTVVAVDRCQKTKNTEKKKGRVQLININHIPELLKEGEEDEDDENSLARKEAEG